MTTMDEMIKNVMVVGVEGAAKTGPRFISLTYTNENGETSRYTLLMGVRLLSLYKSDLRTLQSLVPTLTGIDRVAGQELLDSVTESLTAGLGNNSQYTLKGYYKPVTNNGEIKLHVDNGVTFLYIRGYICRKTVLKNGTYKTVNSSPKTLSKNRIRKLLKVSRIRTFKINTNVLHQIRINGLTIEIN